MNTFTRRQILALSLGLPLLRYSGTVWAQTTPLTRYSATSTHGRKMLGILAKAVELMKNRGDGDPLSWTFQWYTHAVRADKSKTLELSRVFGAGSSPQRSLANDMWSTCRAHSAVADTPYFLPWHRLFVLHFEQIVRALTSEPTFTLPYWNYSTASAAQHGKLPTAFRSPTSAKYGALYRADRNPGVNQGQAIDGGDPTVLALDVLSEPRFLRSTARTGFTEGIDGGIHGNVHVQVGDPQNMGSIPWAARDPVFWVHHCNIDRLWASWNRNGGLNPSGAWLTESFTFADANGNRITGTAGDVSDLATLGYSYDRFEPAPAGFVPASAGPAAVEAEVAAEQHDVSLGGGITTVSLPPPAGPAAPTKTLGQRVHDLAPGRQIFLSFDHLTASAPPGCRYRVYVNLPAQASAAVRQAHYAGSIQFFGAVGRTAPSTPEERAAPGVRITLNITRLAKRLQTSGTLNQPLKVQIEPAGSAQEGSQPRVGQIRLIEE